MGHGPYVMPDRLGPMGPGLLPFLGGATGFEHVVRLSRNGNADRLCVRELGQDPAMARSLAALTSAPPPMTMANGDNLSFDRPLIMGILNVTPDSFSDGGRFDHVDTATRHAQDMIAAGADIIDVGGESTRPGAAPISQAEELSRIRPVLENLKGCSAPISIDTRRPEVMRQAIALGASIINDVSGLTFDPSSVAIVAELDRPVILCHAQGTPQNMQDNPCYDDVLLDVFDWFTSRLDMVVKAGMDPNKIVLDPGIGFGKTVAHNLTLISQLRLFCAIGRPLLVGLSRKRFIAALSSEAPADQRLAGTIAANQVALEQGAAILRVHDVAEAAQAIALHQALMQHEAQNWQRYGLGPNHGT